MRGSIDRQLLGITVALAAGGLLVISSASVVISERNFSTPYYYFLHQLAAVLAGLVLLAILQAVDYRWWRTLALPILLAALVLMAAVFLPQFGLRAGGAARWLHIGPVSIQPSELLKISLILYLARWLDRARGRTRGLAAAIPFFTVMAVVAAILALQKDIGTLLVIGGTAVILYFMGGGRVTQIVAFLLLAAVALWALIQFEPYRMQRLSAFINPSGAPQGVGYHITQALIAIGSGGFFGRGYGHSIQKYNYLPEPTGDSVFAIIIEEFGFFGALVLAGLFMAFFLRALALSRRTADLFGKLVLIGGASLIMLQALINMAAISGLLPLTGIPLPFISYGGTSVAAMLGLVGIMLNISRHAGEARRPGF